MPYVTHQQLEKIPGAKELARVAGDMHRPAIDPTLMALTLRGEDRSAYSADAIAQADDALARIDTVIDEADRLIDGYVGRRYRLPLTLTPDAATTLSGLSRAITRYKLHTGRISDEKTDPIARDYQDALRMLREIGDAKFSLGIDDPQTQSTDASEVLIDTGQKVFGRRVWP